MKNKNEEFGTYSPESDRPIIVIEEAGKFAETFSAFPYISFRKGEVITDDKIAEIGNFIRDNYVSREEIAERIRKERGNIYGRVGAYFADGKPMTPSTVAQFVSEEYFHDIISLIRKA